MASLNDLRIQQTARVLGIDGGGAITQRLMAMGLLPGVQVRLMRVAPLGDPIAVDFEGCQLCLRRSEAAALRVAAD